MLETVLLDALVWTQRHRFCLRLKRRVRLVGAMLAKAKRSRHGRDEIYTHMSFFPTDWPYSSHAYV
jgi:hypothetical protein